MLAQYFIGKPYEPSPLAKYVVSEDAELYSQIALCQPETFDVCYQNLHFRILEVYIFGSTVRIGLTEIADVVTLLAEEQTSVIKEAAVVLFFSY